jgi:hypothetical protein
MAEHRSRGASVSVVYESDRRRVNYRPTVAGIDTLLDQLYGWATHTSGGPLRPVHPQMVHRPTVVRLDMRG